MTTESFLFAMLVCGIVGAAIGATRGGSAGITGFFAGAFFGPLGWILIALSPKQGLKCNACRSLVDKHAYICQHCRSDLRAVGVRT